MRSSDCEKFAQQCLDIARALPPEQKKLLLEMAEQWRKAGAQLRSSERAAE
jgi:hypothetical protein